MSNYKTTKAYSLNQEKEYLVLETTDHHESEEPQVYVVDLSSQSDLTDLVRDFCGDCYDKHSHNNKYVVNGVGRKGFEKPKEELTDKEKDLDVVYDIYDRQLSNNYTEETPEHKKMFSDICGLIEDAKSKGVVFDDYKDEDVTLGDRYLADEEDIGKKSKPLSKRLKDEGIRVHTFIKDLVTGEELWSKYEGQFVKRDHPTFKRLHAGCFIDDTNWYCRVGGDKGIDWEYIEKPLEMCVTRGSYGKDGKGPLVKKFIGELETAHIKKILETKKLKPSLRELFEMVLEKRKNKNCCAGEKGCGGKCPHCKTQPKLELP